MWLVTPIGSFSIVSRPADKRAGTLTVRSRVRGDLLALREQYLPSLGPITESLDSDYRYRARAPRAEVAAAMSRMVERLDYGNFKSEVARRQGVGRASLYHDVWDVLFRLQTDDAFRDKDPVAASYGGVVVSGGGKVLLREPLNHYAGYAWTFAKTEPEPGESPRDTAVRAVREKTGYAARIRGVIPGAFEGGGGVTSGWYLMEAAYPPERPGWQTTGLRWVKFDEARDLIRQSTNEAGRDRDLAVLNAAERAMTDIPHAEPARAQPEDFWDPLRPMPARHVVLYPALRYGADELRRIERGFVPTTMDQRWFMVVVGNRLRIHRSWTGILAYDVGLARDTEGGATVTEVVVNREPDESGDREDDEDLKEVEELIRGHLLEPVAEPGVDSLAQGVALASQPSYLGSPQVVAPIVHALISAGLRVLKEELPVDDLVIEINKAVVPFTEDGTGYTRMPGWHTVEQLGVAVRQFLPTAGQKNEGDTLDAILGFGFAAFLMALNDLMQNFFADPAATWADHALPQINEMKQFVVAVLLGTNTVVYGDKTLADFHWKPVATH